MRKLLIGFSIVGMLGLGACAQTEGFVAGDLTTAAAIANSPNVPATAAAANAVDPTGYSCWGSMAPAVAAIQARKTVGGASLIEVARVLVIQSRKGGQCAALASPILSQLALLPGAANAIAIAATSVQ